MKRPSLVARNKVSQSGELSKNARICERLASRCRAPPLAAPATPAGRDRGGLFTSLSVSLVSRAAYFKGQPWSPSVAGMPLRHRQRTGDPPRQPDRSRLREDGFRCALPILHDTIKDKGGDRRRYPKEWHDGPNSRYRGHALSRLDPARQADGRA